MAIAMPGSIPVVKSIAVVTIGILAVGDELKKLRSDGPIQNDVETQEAEP